jgi:hypothetical protein
MADPWMKFYTSDWRADPRLKMCSAAARGVWIEMICLMHEATPYGHLLIHGQSPNEAQLASLTGIPSADLPDMIAELERMGVFSRTREGVVYSRKLVRMASTSAKARKNGKLGGNPTLGKERGNQPPLNLDLKGDVKAQKPEARYQKEEVGKPTSWRFDEFWAAWPNKVSKQAAEDAWRKLSENDRADAFLSVPTWFPAWREQHPQASPLHAATYLNKRRWLDQFQPKETAYGKPTNRRDATQGTQRPDPALEQIARLAGLGATPGDGRGGTGGFGEEDGPLRMGARPQ